MHVALTGEQSGYYGDYAGPSDVARAMDQGFVYQGQHSRFRRRRHGAPSAGLQPSRFVEFVQNHDQVGNRAGGERLSALVKPEQVRLAAALVALAPGVPLLFMGEEYAESAPFAYFVDHGDPALVEAVRRGRAEEHGRTEVDVLDPADPGTFERCILDRPVAPRAAAIGDVWLLYQSLLALRSAEPALRRSERTWTHRPRRGRRRHARPEAMRRRPSSILFNLSASDATGRLPEQDAGVLWEELLGRRASTTALGSSLRPGSSGSFERPGGVGLMRVWPGSPRPLGATWDGEGVNFAIFSENATAVQLLLFDDADSGTPSATVSLQEVTDRVWHAYLPDVRPGDLYGYKIDGPYEPSAGHRFNNHKLLLDPYAKAVSGLIDWDDDLFGYTVGHDDEDLSLDPATRRPRCPSPSWSIPPSPGGTIGRPGPLGTGRSFMRHTCAG